MKLGKVLFPTDFSITSESALRLATALAREAGARLVIVHVKHDDIPPPSDAGPIEIPQGSDEIALTRMLHEFVPADNAVACEHHLLSGDPAEEILRYAERQRVDLIVMATHGRTGLSRMLMGSVAEEIVRRAACPVLTVKQPWNPPD